MVPFEKSKMISFASSIMKNIFVFLSLSGARFPEKLICYFAFRSASSSCCFVKSIAIMLYFLK